MPISAVRSVDARVPQAERRSRSEQRIIGAALHLIARHGLEGLSLAEAGEAAGYSRGLPVHLFGNRAELLRRCALSLTDEVGQSSDAIDLAQAIDGWVELLTTRPDFARAYYMLVAAALREPNDEPFAQVMRDFSHRMQQRFAAILRHDSRRADSDFDAWMIHATLRGVGLQWLLRPDLVSFARVRAALLKPPR